MNPQASQAHVTSVLCKLTLSQESRCCVTSDHWDFVWEIKYWALRTLNIIIIIHIMNYEESDRGQTITAKKPNSMNNRWIHTKQQESIKGNSPLFIL